MHDHAAYIEFSIGFFRFKNIFIRGRTDLIPSVIIYSSPSLVGFLGASY